MYDIYLGGLDMEKFPRLFKRAIPFKMNIKLEDFVKEYICMEQDIHIEDMQESVMQYGRMRQRIEDTLKEAKSLEEIKESFVKFKTKKRGTGLLSVPHEQTGCPEIKNRYSSITAKRLKMERKI